MVYSLDYNGDTALADSVMECAEPPAGIYICVYSCSCTLQLYTLSETAYQMYTTDSWVEGEMI